MLIDKLPRELCDMILDHLLEYEREQIVLSVHHVNKWNVDEGHPMRCVKPLFEGLYQPYFAYPYCVHEKFALEAAEALYRVALVRVVDYKQLEKHLHRDVFSTACLPSDHIRRVEIEMTFPEGSYHRIPHKLEYTKFVGLTAPPFKIKHLKDLQIRLVIARFWATSTQSSFIKLEEVLAPTIHQLHHSGTKVIWFSRDDEFEPLYAIDRLTLNRDYTQSMEDMMDGITANSVSVSDHLSSSGYKTLIGIGCSWLLNIISLVRVAGIW
jgi:hypothetical protein